MSLGSHRRVAISEVDWRSPEDYSRMPCHSQISITLDTYSHVLPSMQKEATEKMDAMFAGLAR